MLFLLIPVRRSAELIESNSATISPVESTWYIDLDVFSAEYCTAGAMEYTGVPVSTRSHIKPPAVEALPFSTFEICWLDIATSLAASVIEL